MPFLSKYRNLRGANTEGVREVEYNSGRMFHQLVSLLWIIFYFYFYFIIDFRDDHFARETAYNLALTFVFTGAMPLADALYRRWLSI
ncbi:hypothetical protein BYT27DRAFT_7080280 [Phlegmacium glaucopus]|nr:hypothetical protein BYT27DRAFT_7080280 [Phlegmacium glaucopus]